MNGRSELRDAVVQPEAVPSHLWSSTGITVEFDSAGTRRECITSDDPGHNKAAIADVGPRTPVRAPLACDAAALRSSLLTIDDAARHLCVSVRMIKQLLSDGHLAYVKIGRATRIAQKDLDRYVEQNRRKRRSSR